MRYRKLLLFAALLFCCGKATAQDKLKKLDTWLADNAEILGGRDMLLIYKDGKIIYSHSEDKMLPRQKMLQGYIARKKGETVDLDSYTPASRQPIASCSKWLSAALVMTFVDEGKLSLSDTVGKYLPVLMAHGKG
jgi:CubicO group peptidase (beta-lactamase class C family)